MKLLQEIRQQPLHIRKTFVWVLTILAFSLVGFAWARHTKQQVATLLNGPQQSTTTEFASTANQPSPFSALRRSFGDLKASIGSLWSHREEFRPAAFQKNPEQSPIPPNKLPVSSP